VARKSQHLQDAAYEICSASIGTVKTVPYGGVAERSRPFNGVWFTWLWTGRFDLSIA